MRKVVILTAISIERKAVRAYLPDRSRETHPRSGAIYDKGTFTTVNGSWEVAIAEIGMGNTTSALAAQQAIDHFSPDLLFFVGIAGGLKDVKPGDVVISTKIYQYASGKAARNFLPRPEIGLAAYSLVQLARALVSDDDWQGQIKGASTVMPPQAFVGAIAAGEQVLTSTDATTWKHLQAYYSDALAVEMEGYGALKAAHDNQQVKAIVIRGISDTLENKTELEKQNYQEIAARHASAFAFEMLAQMAPAAETPTIVSPQQAPITHASKPVTREPESKTSTAQTTFLKVFYSYADSDKSLMEDIKKQLTMLRRTNQIQEWETSQILPGENRQREIDLHLQQDDVFILGISSSYIASNAHYDEMEEALKQRTLRSAIVIPIILRPVERSELPTKHLLTMPFNDKCVIDDRENFSKEIAIEIRKMVNARLGNLGK